MTTSRLIFLALTLVLFFTSKSIAADPPAGDKGAEKNAAALDSLDRHFAQQLTVLADKCDSLQLPEQAKITRGWQIKRTKGRHNLFIPLSSDPHEPAAAAPDLVKKWHEKFHSIRVEHAGNLYKIAEEYLAAGDAARTYQLLHEVLREDPDHEQARKALGYVRVKGKNEWSSHAVVPKADVVRAPHPKTGWINGKHLRLETPRWRIATNAPPPASLDLAKKLEDFHLLWRQIFFDYWCTRSELQSALAGVAPLPAPKVPMNVYLFNTRAEYTKFLAPVEPQAAVTQGYYSAAQQTAIFYAGDDAVQPTWFHEAAHQLFQQWRDSKEGPGDRQNFWLVEGAAMYVESLQNHGSHWTVGGWQSDRLQIPRYRALSGDKGLKLQELVALGREKVQADRKELGKLYGQFAAKVHFLLDHPDAGYRQSAAALLKELYAQTDKLTSLAELTGVSLEELDQQSQAAWQVTDDDLLNTPGLARQRNLALGRTQVTEKGLAALADCRELRWLDLTAVPATDATLAHIKDCPKLEQLFLDTTKITDASLPLIATFSALEELDLCNLPLTDSGFANLTKLRKLKTLYITGSNVSPAAVQRLRSSLPKLEITP